MQSMPAGQSEGIQHYGKRYRQRLAQRRDHKTPGSKQKGEYLDVKKVGKPFKGVAKEVDKRRK
jgi:hypothetical protein